MKRSACVSERSFRAEVNAVLNVWNGSIEQPFVHRALLVPVTKLTNSLHCPHNELCVLSRFATTLYVKRLIDSYRRPKASEYPIPDVFQRPKFRTSDFCSSCSTIPCVPNPMSVPNRAERVAPEHLWCEVSNRCLPSESLRKLARVTDERCSKTGSFNL